MVREKQREKKRTNEKVQPSLLFSQKRKRNNLIYRNGTGFKALTKGV